MAQRIHVEGNPDRVRRPDRGAKQDEQGHRARGGVDGAAPQADGLVRPHLVGTPIYKMTGAGNDFVLVEGRPAPAGDWSPEDIRAGFGRGTGRGADGLVFVSPGSAPNVVRMIYFNADGSHAAMCGNAALCSAWLATRLGLANPGADMVLETDAGTYESRCAAGGDRPELHLAAVRAPGAVPGLILLPGESRVALGTVGVPHLVVLVQNVDGVDVGVRGKALRSDPALGPAGANVTFLSAGASPSEGPMRTCERGVEEASLACGTGAVGAVWPRAAGGRAQAC